MARRDSGNYARKHSPDRKAAPAVAEAVNQRAKEGKISCAAAFGIVSELDVSQNCAAGCRNSIRARPSSPFVPWVYGPMWVIASWYRRVSGRET